MASSRTEFDVDSGTPLEIQVNGNVAIAGRLEPIGVSTIRVDGAAHVTLVSEGPEEDRLTILMWILYGVFYALERASIAFWVRGAFARRVSRWASAQFMDSYVLGWVLFEIMLYVFAPKMSLSVLLVVVVYRLIELTQAYTNIVIFHRFRHDTATYGPYRIVSHWRTFVIGVVNLIEGALLYGLIYFVAAKNWSGGIAGVSSPWDALYFSFVTITTLGYGDIQPTGLSRVVSAAESVWGLLFGIALLGRFVASLPTDRALDRPQR